MSNSPLDSVRALLLAEEQARLQKLQTDLETARWQAEQRLAEVRARLAEVEAELADLRAQARATDDRARDLQAEVSILRRKSQEDAEGVVARVTPVLGDMIGRAIRDSRDDMAEALGPVMGEAIRVQIRDSRQDMVEALYPVIGETVQRAINEFAREFQRNVDAQLRATFGPEGFLQALWARLRGVSPAQLALRNALPFEIQQIFLIQRDSGLLLAHISADASASADSDLIGGMLTAIRDFVRDSFGRGQEELDEVQYGDQRIIVSSGRTAYVAAVISGVEPQGFRAHLRQWLSDLHVKYETALRQYTGDPATLPNLTPRLNRLREQAYAGPALPRRLSRNQRLALAALALVFLAGTALACFYVQFTIALLPVAFPSATPTVTFTATSTATATASATPSHTPTATFTPTRTPTFTPSTTPSATSTPTATFTPSTTPTPTLSPTPILAYLNGNVWVRDEPLESAPRRSIAFVNLPVTVRAGYGEWAEVEWVANGQVGRGWVPLRWVITRDPIPPDKITPTRTPTPILAP